MNSLGKVLISLVLFFVLSISINAHAADAPILWLKFDDGSGNTPQDSGANNVDGSFTATQPTWSENVPSVSFSNPYSLSFASAGDAVDVSWPAELDFAATDPRSFSFWYKPTANGEGQYSRLISWSNDRLEIAGTEAGTSTHKITYFDGDWHATDITLSIGTWYHVTFTYDGTTAKFYIGGELQDEHPLAGRALSGTLRIGNRVQQLDEGVNGLIDDVRIYDYALNSTQVGNLTSGSNDPDSAPDGTAPSVSVTSPTNGSTIGGNSINVTATATDNVGVTGVTFYYDTSNAIGGEVTSPSSGNTYSTTFNASVLSEGSHTFKAVARDAANNSTTSSIVTVTVDKTGPTFSSISSSSTSTGATITWSTNEASSTKIIYSTDTSYGSSTLEADTSSRVTSHSQAITGLTSCTTYNYKVVSVDSVENSGTSSSNTFTTDGCSRAGAVPVSILQSISENMRREEEVRGCTTTTAYSPVTGFKCSNTEIQSKKEELNNKCPSLPFRKVLKLNMIDLDIKLLQQALNCRGYVVALEGPGSLGKETTKFGSLTKKALIKFQKENQIQQDGIFGDITAGILNK